MRRFFILIQLLTFWRNFATILLVMLMIRLQRIGRRHDPQFRVVLTDSRRGPKSGNFKEILGSYNAKSGDIQLNADRITHWIGFGAQTSGTVHNFLVSKGIIKADKINVLPKKTRIVSEQPAEEIKAEAAPAAVEAEAPVEEVSEAPAEETPVIEEAAPEAEATEEAPAEEEKKEEVEA